MDSDIKKKENQYYIVLSYEMLREAAIGEGYENIIFCEDGLLSEEQIDTIKNSGRAVAFVSFLDDDFTTELSQQLETFQPKRVRYAVENFIYDPDFDHPDEEKKRERSLEFFKNRLHEGALIDRGLILDTDYSGRCGNCAASLGDNDKYCRVCGTERGKGKFEPFKNMMLLGYGPPTKLKYKCSSCGDVWVEFERLGKETTYCPKCGADRIEKTDETQLDWDDIVGK